MSLGAIAADSTPCCLPRSTHLAALHKTSRTRIHWTMVLGRRYGATAEAASRALMNGAGRVHAAVQWSDMDALPDRQAEKFASEEMVLTQRENSDRTRLTVRDGGVGFDPKNRGKLFDAFRTTKSGGMGIGLKA